MKNFFDRPIFIVAAPRSCSTLLFQTLAQSEALWSLGDESHHIFESHPKLRPITGLADSNRLVADVLDEVLEQSIPAAFYAQIKDRSGSFLKPDCDQKIRLLEKTPKHSLRIPFLNALFPDALFIYLFRDPKKNINSIIEAWRSGRFVMYPTLRTRHGPWSLLLPPEWREQVSKPIEEIASFQWLSANRFIIEDLKQIAPDRRVAINADELLMNPLSSVRRLCDFMGIGLDDGLHAYLKRPLPLSRYTLSAPGQDKWRENGESIERIWPKIIGMISAINEFIGDTTRPLETAITTSDSGIDRLRRNSLCHCGSGIRYKACHGLIR